MAYSKTVIAAAFERLERRKLENRLTADQRHAAVCKAIPEYAELELELAATMTRSVGAIVEKQGDSGGIISKALEENAAIQQKMARLLVENNFPENYIAPIYTCERCRDSGAVDGQWCECFTNMLNAAASEELNASSPLRLSTFESFDLTRYSEEQIKGIQGTHRANMEKILLACKEFAENFRKDSRGFLMLGDTGLGKTHLSLAIASTVIEKGYSAVYNSAPELMRKLNKEFYGRSDADTMGLITACDLLILDDLGAEPDSDQNVSMLYEIVNARQNRQIPIIVNSNLSVEELRSRYKDRVVSRLFSLNTLFFYGKDNRLLRARG